MVEENTGLSRAHVDVALAYWGAYPDDVDAMIAHADERPLQRASL